MKYPLLNKIKIPLITTTISLIIMYTPLGSFFINKYLPCQYAGNYAARYASLCIGGGPRALIFALFILGILILSLLIIAIKSIKYYRNHKKL